MKLLLVDDDLLCLESIRDGLQLNGYETDAFSNPEQALAAYIRQPYHVVVTDYAMPKMDGCLLIQAIHQYDPNVYAILISGQLSLITNSTVRFYACFAKPLDFCKLIDTLEQLAKKIY